VPAPGVGSERPHGGRQRRRRRTGRPVQWGGPPAGTHGPGRCRRR
jgi:hypothetical protein